MTPKFEYDPEANAACIRFSSEKSSKAKRFSDGIVLDYDTEGHIVGMEVLEARQNLPRTMLEQAA